MSDSSVRQSERGIIVGFKKGMMRQFSTTLLRLRVFSHELVPRTLDLQLDQFGEMNTQGDIAHTVSNIKTALGGIIWIDWPLAACAAAAGPPAPAGHWQSGRWQRRAGAATATAGAAAGSIPQRAAVSP
jgi:hypothetical protein